MSYDLSDILGRCHLFCVFVIIGNPTSDNYAFQVEFPRQIFSGLVKPSPDFHGPVLRMNHDLYSVKVVSLWVMCGYCPFSSDFIPCVLVVIFVKSDNKTRARPYYFSVELYANLSLREN